MFLLGSGITIKHIRIRNKEEKEKKVYFADDYDSDDGVGGSESTQSKGGGRSRAGSRHDEYVNRKSNNFLDNYLISKLDDSSSSDDEEAHSNPTPQNTNTAEGAMEDAITKQMEEAMLSDGDDAAEHKATDDGSGASDPELDRKVITKEIEIEALSVYNDIAHDEQKGDDIIWHEEALSDEALRTKFSFIPSVQCDTLSLSLSLSLYV